MIGRLLVARRRRFLGEVRNLVRPFPFTAYAKVDQRFNAVADHRSGIVIDRAFHRAFVVVNEQPAQIADPMTRFLWRNSRLPTSALAVQLPSSPWSSTREQPARKSTFDGSFFGGAIAL